MMLHHSAHQSSARAMLLVLKRSHSHVHVVRRLTHEKDLSCAISPARRMRKYVGAVPTTISFAASVPLKMCLLVSDEWISKASIITTHRVIPLLTSTFHLLYRYTSHQS
jgi:hypothetical protein